MIIIDSIGKEAFHQLLPTDTAWETAVGAEVEWLVDREKTVIGTVGFGGQDKGWSYAILKRDTPSGFRVWGRQAHFSTLHKAKIMLRQQMAGAEAVGTAS